MLHVRGRAGGTELTGELFERGEAVPQFEGAPDDGAPFTWVCDEFYQVASGGQVQQVGGESVNIAFEPPTPRGFDTREEALAAAEDHLRTQFARIGVDPDAVAVSVERDAATGDSE
ncbi:hypothetical protein ACKVMT_07140 [Halobacteriales archaeon Cl-PHB]